jgi:hypothetical protein
MKKCLICIPRGIPKQATAVAMALACVICGCGEKNAPPPVAAPTSTQPSVASSATQPSIAEGSPTKPAPVQMGDVFTLDTLMNRIPTNTFSVSEGQGWDKFTMPKVKEWVRETLYGKRARLLVAALECNVAQDGTDPKPDEWIVRLEVTGRHANYAGMGNRLLPIPSAEGYRKSITDLLGVAAFVLKCNEAEARKWDALGVNTPAPVMIEGDIVEISFTPRFMGLDGYLGFTNTFVGYDTIVRLDNVALALSNDLEPISVYLPELAGFLHGTVREPERAITEIKRLDSSGDYQLIYMKYRCDYGKKVWSRLFLFPLVKAARGFRPEQGMYEGTSCSDPPTESEIAEAKVGGGWPKSGK